MADLAQLHVLADLLADAEGPDRDLNMLLWWTFDRPAAESTYWRAATGLPHPLGDKIPSGLGRVAVRQNSPPFTNSQDAAWALTRQQLPGWKVRVGDVIGSTESCATLCSPDASDWSSSRCEQAYGPTPALSLLRVLVAVLIALAEGAL